MISWIQKYFQHHFRVIFAVLLAVIIVAFVFTIGAAPGIGNAERKIQDAPFFDLNLALQADQQKLFGDAQLSILLQNGYPAQDSAQLQQYAFLRYASLVLADRLNLPAPSPAQVTDHIQKLRFFAGEDGAFDAKRYNEFRANPRKLLNVSEADVLKVIADDIRSENLSKLLGGPGYISEHEIKTQLERVDSTWTVATATADYKSYAPLVPTTDSTLQKYYDENAARYEVPPQVSVRIAEFPATAHIGNVAVTDAEIQAYYDANPARFPNPAANPAAKPDDKTPANPAADYAAVRPQVELALRLERAKTLAAKAASEFALALYNQKITPGTPAFDALLAEKKLTLKPLAPFSRDNPPADLRDHPEAVDEAFKLGADRLTSGAITTPTGSALLFWQESIPARTPLLAEVKTKVTADYIENETRNQFAQLGKTLRAQLETRLKAGDTFEQAVAAVSAASPVKLTHKTHAPFTLRQRPQDLDYSVLGALRTLEKGGLSDMTADADKGTLVYCADKKLPDLSETNPQYQTTRKQIAQGLAARNSGEYLSEIVARELTKAKPAAN